MLNLDYIYSLQTIKGQCVSSAIKIVFDCRSLNVEGGVITWVRILHKKSLNEKCYLGSYL